MKLLLCTQCNEVFSLSGTYRECAGGHAGGRYIDQLNAHYWGEKNRVFVLGFANNEFVKALREQINEGDLPPRHIFGYGKVSPGREFLSFVIPESASSVKYFSKRTDSEYL